MTDRKKVIRMLNNTLRHCHNLYNHVTSEEQTWLAEINQGAKEALELLKEPEAINPTVSSFEEHDGHGSWWYQCGKCKTSIDCGDRFCRHRGQAVKWK